MDLYKPQKQKPRQPAHPGEMKFLQVQEAPNCPAAKGCVMKNSTLLALQLLILSGLHCYIFHIALMLKNTSASFVTQNQSWKKKAKNLFY